MMILSPSSTFLRALAGCAVLLGLVARVAAQATESAPATAPATAPAKPHVTPAADAILDEIRQAYASLNSLEMAGVVTLNLDAAGQKRNDKSNFTAWFQSPDRFRHEMSDDLLVVSNGQKAFLYKSDLKKYLPVDAPKGRQPVADLPAMIGVPLAEQNRSLLMAITQDAADTLTLGASHVDRGPDVTLDGTSYAALNLKTDTESIRLLIDPKTHLLRQLSIDVKQSLIDQGVPQVNAAEVTIDYTKSQPNAQVAQVSFDWTPPADASEVKPPAQRDPALAGAAENPESLVGKPAPDFSLKDMDDKDVKLSSNKGSVVVLDFWATWCGPCREGLPHLNKLYNELSPQGLKVWAVNLREPKDKAAGFMKQQNLTLPVLLDSEATVADLYRVSGIPQTVVIGKDGHVKKVLVGFGPGSDQQLRQAVTAALAE